MTEGNQPRCAYNGCESMRTHIVKLPHQKFGYCRYHWSKVKGYYKNTKEEE